MGWGGGGGGGRKGEGWVLGTVPKQKKSLSE